MHSPATYELPPLELLDMALDALLPVDSRFHIPRLLDKPQNPIMDTLHFWLGHRKSEAELLRAIDTAQYIQDHDSWMRFNNTQDRDLWQSAISKNPPPRFSIVSWDALRFSHASHTFPSAFFSEQSSRDTAAAKYHIYPHLQDPFECCKYVLPETLFQALRLIITGTSSALHVWDSASQTFSMIGVSHEQRGIISITGSDDVVSESVISRFISIGTMIRRLENFVDELRKMPLNPVFHAFAHAVSSILAYNMICIAGSPLLQHDQVSPPSPHALTTIWATYADLQAGLTELSSLCGIACSLTPAQYRSLPNTDVQLLSLIYHELQVHTEKQSAKPITAQFAYIFSATAYVYLERICARVGYPLRSDSSRSLQYEFGSQQRQSFSLLGDGYEDEIGDWPLQEEDETHFPNFIAGGLGEMLLRARKSLVLLRSAQPDHSVLTAASSFPPIRWFWTEAEIEAAFNDKVSEMPASSYAKPAALTSSACAGTMDDFRIFDLEPGSQTAWPNFIPVISSVSRSNYKAFYDTFPPALPSLTPTMANLTTLVLKPLVIHIGTLSGALVDLFLCPSTYLYFTSHLFLLRSYLLLTSHAFKSTLESALFSDSCGDETQTASYATNFGRLRAGPNHSAQVSSETSAHSPWIVGLSLALTPDGTWPPAGASLSFFLRTVIIDSLNSEYRRGDQVDVDRVSYSNNDETNRILQEAEWRLGFAIRDLPVGGGDAKWLSARSMEALDFLYMEYQPPAPLATLITPTILSKYHRIFAFNLRLMRVENVIRALFRMSRRSIPPGPLFPTFTASHRLFLHFRFVSHSFITSLSSYIYDTAIRSNFDAFLAVLSPPSEGSTTHPSRFHDVFSLAEYHSFVMDDILSACLLRSGQKSVGDLLRGALGIVLEFGLLMSDVSTGQVKEYQAVSLLDTLFKRFRTRITTLVKVLAALIERGSLSGRLPAEGPQSTTTKPVSRVIDCLSNLLVRIDVAEWWRNRASQQSAE